MIKTAACELLGIQYPILQGGMVHIATWELASAVSNAGGLGTIGSGNYPPDWVREQIRKIRAATKKPFAVNVLLLSPNKKEVIDVVIEEHVPIVTIGAGIPRKELPELKEAGIKVMPVVGATRFAKMCEEWGADAVIAEGMESGGEIGDMTTIALVPQIVDTVSIPVIAAGGFGDGRGLIAALALGAQGIQMGTRFIASKECIAHPETKRAITNAMDRDTAVSGFMVGTPMRALRNKLTKEFLKKELIFLKIDDPDLQREKKKEFMAYGIGATRRGLLEGDIEFGSLLAGQISGLIKEILSAKEIVDGIMGEAEEVIKNLHRFIS